MLREFGIAFDPLDVPRDKFIDAGRAWGMCRRGEADPKDFGIQDMNGPIFVWGDVMRDVLSLSKVEILPWDGGWGFLDHKLDDPLPDEETLSKYDYIARLASQVNDRFEELIEVIRLEPGLRTPAEWGIPDSG